MRLGMARTPVLVMVAALLAACQPADPDWANKVAMQVGAPRENNAQVREMQTSRFSYSSEERILQEATQVLQDLGFTVEESAPAYGVLAGSKDRDATEAGQVAAQVVITVAAALLGVHYNPVWDTDQVIRVTLTTRPVMPREQAMRVSFERIVTNNQGLSRMEELTGPEYASGFFERVRSGLAATGG